MEGNPARGMRVEAQQAVPPEQASVDLDMSEEYVLGTAGCPTCGVVLGGSLSEPATANDPRDLREQAGNLRRLREAVLAGQISEQQVHERLPELCPVCRATMGDEPSGDTDELASRISYQADLLEDRARALERA